MSELACRSSLDDCEHGRWELVELLLRLVLRHKCVGFRRAVAWFARHAGLDSLFSLRFPEGERYEHMDDVEDALKKVAPQPV